VIENAISPRFSIWFDQFCR